MKRFLKAYYNLFMLGEKRLTAMSQAVRLLRSRALFHGIYDRIFMLLIINSDLFIYGGNRLTALSQAVRLLRSRALFHGIYDRIFMSLIINSDLFMHGIYDRIFMLLIINSDLFMLCSSLKNAHNNLFMHGKAGVAI